MPAENPFASPTPPERPDASTVEPLAPPQAVTYALEEQDYLAFVTHLNNSDATVKKMLGRARLRWLAIAAGFFVLSFLCGPDAADIEALEFMTRGGAIFFAVFAFLLGPLAKRRSRKGFAKSIRNGLLGKIGKSATITLEQSGLRMVDDDGEALRYWQGVHRVAATDDHLFIYLMPMQAAIIPIRAFQTEQQFYGFALLAEELWRAAQKDQAEKDQTEAEA